MNHFEPRTSWDGTELNARIHALGFSTAEPVGSFHSIAHLFGKTKGRCGIYMLGFPDDSIYIGQAKDVVRRFAQHRRNYSSIATFSFLRTRESKLDDVEVDLIRRAEKLGFA